MKNSKPRKATQKPGKKGEIELIFPSLKKLNEFNEFDQKDYVFEWATVNDDGTVEAHFKIKKLTAKKEQKQQNLFM